VTDPCPRIRTQSFCESKLFGALFGSKWRSCHGTPPIIAKKTRGFERTADTFGFPLGRRLQSVAASEVDSDVATPDERVDPSGNDAA
jgi:hypothetical protein